MFNFLMKPQLLPLSKTANVQHFYQFQGKQIQQKQNQQIKKLQELKNKIQTEEQKQKQIKTPKYQVSKYVPSNDSKDKDFSKSYILDSSLKSQSKERPNSTKSFNEFYQKNKKWKQNVQAQILKRKQQKVQQQEKQLSQCRKPLSSKQITQNTGKQNQILTHAFDSKGPISGWTQRFHSFIKKRLPQQIQQDFRPKINKKSQIIASRMVGKVQERLIKFGQIMKMRKHQMVIEEIQKIGKIPNSDTHFMSTNSNKSEFYHRLYKEGQKTNRKTKQKLQQAIKNQCSFRPKITKLDESMEQRIKQKRQKSPLYATKKISKQQTKRLMDMFQKQTGRVMKESDFQNFMRRNQMLLQKKDQNLQKKLKEEILKAESELKECTFIPILNKKSMLMLSKIENEGIMETQQEHEDEFVLEQGPAYMGLFSKNKQNNQQRSASKYSYDHSYGEPQQFQYSINTPTAQKWDPENNFQLRTQTKSRPNQVSEIDSLEFSGQKQLQNNLFNKNNFFIDNLSPNKNHDEIINYELTFSNKKLTKQLQSLHEKNQQQKQQKNFDESYQPDQQMQKRTINDWENQLEKVKNRLQKLMKSNKKKSK